MAVDRHRRAKEVRFGKSLLTPAPDRKEMWRPREERTEMWRRVPVMTVACLRRLARRNDGQDLLEYGLLASLIAMAVMAALAMVGDVIDNVLWRAIAAVKF